MSCYTIKSYPNLSREKQLTLLATHLTECILDLIPRRLLMNSGEERSLLLSILGYLVVIVTFYVIEITVRISALKSYCMMLCMLLCMTLCMT